MQLSRYTVLLNMCSVLLSAVFIISCGVGSLQLTRNGVLDFNSYKRRITTTDDYVKKAGFQSQIHNVVTEDGYILHLTRIKSQKQNVGPPVLIMHGFAAASDGFVKRGRKETIAFILADSGFDVWLGDLRGNIFSRNHKMFNVTTDEKFWDFSFHEMAIYDLPAFIIKILSHSLYSKLFYIGQSMGTTIFYIMASMLPQFNKNIQAAVMLSPIAFPPKEMKSIILKEFFLHGDQIINYLKRQKIYEIMPRSSLVENFIRISCSPPLQDLVCLNFVGLVGEHRSNLNKIKISDYFSTHFSGTSRKTLHHFIQLYNTGEFKQFDFGEIANLQTYGKKTPPFYHLDKVSSPVIHFYSDTDYLLDEWSVQKLSNLLPNIIYQENILNYTHIDFLFGNDAPVLLYNKVSGILQWISEDLTKIV